MLVHVHLNYSHLPQPLTSFLWLHPSTLYPSSIVRMSRKGSWPRSCKKRSSLQLISHGFEGRNWRPVLRVDMPTKEDRQRQQPLSAPSERAWAGRAEECSISLLNIYYKIGQEEQEVEVARGNKGRPRRLKQNWIKNDYYHYIPTPDSPTWELQTSWREESKAVVGESIVWEGTCITMAIQCDVTTLSFYGKEDIVTGSKF